jgi:hypothetical protein
VREPKLAMAELDTWAAAPGGCRASDCGGATCKQVGSKTGSLSGGGASTVHGAVNEH